jgi:L-amino acid N-acyltransferase
MDAAPPGIHIRPVTDADLDAILAIYNDAIETMTAVFEYQPYTREKLHDWLTTKQAAGYPVLVADVDGTLAGFATYGPFRTRPAYKYTVEHSVYVAEHVRRQGVARVLMRALVDDARRRGYHAMVGGVVADNVPSLRFHESSGFVEVAHFREVGYKFGRWLDLKFLQLLFDTPNEPTEG